MNQGERETFFQRFLHSQTSGSMVLMAAAVAAVAWANSPWAGLYHDLSHLKIGFIFGGRHYQMGLAHWVKDGLMTIFFFVVGLEIKREVLLGELSSPRKAALPVVAAIGGCVTPAIIYFLFNPSGPAVGGWGIPMATDIAFALGILALLGDRVPMGLRIFLTALAIVDDLIAVLVIAAFYTERIDLHALGLAALFLLLFLGAIRSNSRRPIFYLVPAVGVWICFMVSGIHATIAGVIIALLVPVRSKADLERFLDTVSRSLETLRAHREAHTISLTSNKEQWRAVEAIYLMADDMMPMGLFLEKHLHPVQAFVILPLFALFSAGVAVNASTFASFPDPVSLGIILGLVVGKQVGIFGCSWAAIKAGMADLPQGVQWSHIWGASILGGIGFTMSIFISELAFKDPLLVDRAKIAIFMASIMAGVLGYLALKVCLSRGDAQ